MPKQDMAKDGFCFFFFCLQLLQVLDNFCLPGCCSGAFRKGTAEAPTTQREGKEIRAMKSVTEHTLVPS